MSNSQKIPKWWQVYPAGTTVGNEEKKFFVAIARHPQYKYRSASSIAQETGLTKVRVEEIIIKYHKIGMLVQNDKNAELWGYWETVGLDQNAYKTKTVSDEDKEMRIKKVVKK